ncbi:hypothetical protein NA57DRAFT_53850 [Rhizodiscina lignyota]|uniref:Uncharacterized protein n=1 Tax=Rhizodiscina lignyota TaxID=1504668 RepID=A0A9P4M8P8_9PEZI|nr:hypothetical protein NA57DRAFT_53850 [Rhizodiscina lignyota]
MVSTRNHPKNFPPPALGASPTKSHASMSPTSSPTDDGSANGQLRNRSQNQSAPRPSSSSGSSKYWSHTPTRLTLIWLGVAIPLVIWDTFYILLRPWTMPGGWMHEPIWKPYALYTTVDYVYGWPAFNANDGFPSAQGALNALETAAYVWYVWMVWRYGVDEGRPKARGNGVTAAAKGSKFFLFEKRRIEGLHGAQMVLVLCVASWVTLSKTVLYWLIEYFNGYAHIGHNSLWTLFSLWIVPNGLWLVFPAVIIYSTSKDILRGLCMAAGVPGPSKPALL